MSVADDLQALLDSGQTGLLMLLSSHPAYRLGDRYEIDAVASALTVGPDHLRDVDITAQRMRAVAFFPVELAPPSYRDRVNEHGRVEIPIEVPLDGATLGRASVPPAP